MPNYRKIVKTVHEKLKETGLKWGEWRNTEGGHSEVGGACDDEYAKCVQHYCPDGKLVALTVPRSYLINYKVTYYRKLF